MPDPGPLRVLGIPSWYPSAAAPILGVFSQEQFLAVGDMRPNWSVAVAVWGQGEYDFALRRPGQWPRRLASYMRGGPARRELRPNVVEHRARAATWARQLLGGNLRGVERAAGELLDRAAGELGGIDLIHAHVSYPGGMVAMRLRERTGIPFVLTEHWGYPPRGFVRDGVLDDRVRAPMLAADSLVGVSRSQAADIESWGLPRPEVVPGCVDEEVFSPGSTAPGDGVVLTAICNMVEGKGIDDLLRALSLVLPRLGAGEREHVELRLGGTGPALPRYRALAEALGVSRHVRWLGLLSREQVVRELRACSCFVLPSRRESFGVVYAEAMACGKPVIAARSGGPEDIVTDATGVLVEPADEEGLAGALEAAVREPGRWDPAAIRESFLTRFSRPAVVDRLERVYRGVL